MQNVLLEQFPKVFRDIEGLDMHGCTGELYEWPLLIDGLYADDENARVDRRGRPSDNRWLWQSVRCHHSHRRTGEKWVRGVQLSLLAF